MSQLRLDLSVPQSQMISRPRGYVPPASWIPEHRWRS
ncbi:FimD/PapC N-terminal domain-containing protein [Escherichia coli]